MLSKERQKKMMEGIETNVPVINTEMINNRDGRRRSAFVEIKVDFELGGAHKVRERKSTIFSECMNTFKENKVAALR